MVGTTSSRKIFTCDSHCGLIVSYYIITQYSLNFVVIISIVHIRKWDGWLYYHHHVRRKMSTAGYKPPPKVVTTIGPALFASNGFPQPLTKLIGLPYGWSAYTPSSGTRPPLQNSSALWYGCKSPLKCTT